MAETDLHVTPPPGPITSDSHSPASSPSSLSGLHSSHPDLSVADPSHAEVPSLSTSSHNVSLRGTPEDVEEAGVEANEQQSTSMATLQTSNPRFAPSEEASDGHVDSIHSSEEEETVTSDLKVTIVLELKGAESEVPPTKPSGAVQESQEDHNKITTVVPETNKSDPEPPSDTRAKVLNTYAQEVQPEPSDTAKQAGVDGKLSVPIVQGEAQKENLTASETPKDKDAEKETNKASSEWNPDKSSPEVAITLTTDTPRSDSQASPTTREKSSSEDTEPSSPKRTLAASATPAFSSSAPDLRAHVTSSAPNPPITKQVCSISVSITDVPAETPPGAHKSRAKVDSNPLPVSLLSLFGLFELVEHRLLSRS